MKKFNNYVNAIDTLEELANIDFNDYSRGSVLVYENMISGFINHFNKAFELSWKLQKDILKYEGVSEVESGSPKQILRCSCQYGLICGSDAWIKMTNVRNESTHIYDKDYMYDLLDAIKAEFIPLLHDFKETAYERVYALYTNKDLPDYEVDEELKTTLKAAGFSVDDDETPDFTGQGGGRK